MEIPLSKKPENPQEREILISEIIKQEEEIILKNIGYLQRLMIDKLIDKGYALSDMEINKTYEIILSEEEKFYPSVDLLIRLEDKIIFAIKCTPTSIDSWQRFMFAFCRVVEPYQIPFAFITNGEEGRLIDIFSGEVKETSDFPTKEALLKLLPSIDFNPYDEKKLPKEKRILYAFDAIKCCPTI